MMGKKTTALEIREMEAMHEFHALLLENHPDTFGGREKPFQRLAPLKVGIREDLIAAYPDVPWPTIRHFICWYIYVPNYLKLIKPGAARLDLSAKVVGEVTENEAKHALHLIERYRDRWTQRSRNAQDAYKLAEATQSAS
jgi:sRNA-binding protein